MAGKPTNAVVAGSDDGGSNRLLSRQPACWTSAHRSKQPLDTIAGMVGTGC
jgi:hypothetical protein